LKKLFGLEVNEMNVYENGDRIYLVCEVMSGKKELLKIIENETGIDDFSVKRTINFSNTGNAKFFFCEEEPLNEKLDKILKE